MSMRNALLISHHTVQKCDAVFSTLGFEGVERGSPRLLQAGGDGAVCLNLPLKNWVTIMEGLPLDVYSSVRNKLVSPTPIYHCMCFVI